MAIYSKPHEFILIFQRYRLCAAGSAFIPVSGSATIRNMITITGQVAIRTNTAFSNFRNTIYALGYADTLYDKPYNTSKVVDYLIAYRQRYNLQTNALNCHTLHMFEYRTKTKDPQRSYVGTRSNILS